MAGMMGVLEGVDMTVWVMPDWILADRVCRLPQSSEGWTSMRPEYCLMEKQSFDLLGLASDQVRALSHHALLLGTSDTFVYIHSFQILSHIGNYRILNKVPWAIW